MERRAFLRVVGATVVAGLAGCNSTEGDQADESLSGENYPAVDDWLTETEVGGEAPNYDGMILDRRQEETIQIGVGAGDTGTEFAPAAVAVSAGTTIQWLWTGEGGAHTVVADPTQQIEESDYEFSSGSPVDREGNTYERTLDEAGITLYHCDQHLEDGMKGAVIVE